VPVRGPFFRFKREARGGTHAANQHHQKYYYENDRKIHHRQCSRVAVARVDKNTDLWLFTSRDSDKVREIEADSCVQVHGQDGWANCVVFTGRATVVEDRAMIREIWKPAFKVWFPNGADDPNIVLLHVKGEHAEYWDNTGVTALVTGPTLEIKDGEQHANVELSAG
jgi:general stress protein 26